jgi:small subunit ribosomal protein S8e
MSESHGKSKKKKSGGKLRKHRDKIRAELGREPLLMVMGETDRKQVRGRGGNKKQCLRHDKMINVVDPSTGKVKRTEITTVLENTANRHYVRRNVITKGAVVETKLGKVKVTSRPGQDGVVNGVLVKE